VKKANLKKKQAEFHAEVKYVVKTHLKVGPGEMNWESKVDSIGRYWHWTVALDI